MRLRNSVEILKSVTNYLQGAQIRINQAQSRYISTLYQQGVESKINIKCGTNSLWVESCINYFNITNKLIKHSQLKRFYSNDKQNQIVDMKSLPENWPPNIQYIRRNINQMEWNNIRSHSKNIPINSDENYNFVPTHSFVQIQKLPPNHVAYDPVNGYGLFSIRIIQKDDLLGEYVGIILSSNEKHNYKSDFFMNRNLTEIHPEFGTLIDAMEAGNEMRFINDYRGISNESNCYCIKENGRIFIRAKNTIEPGKEILLNYGHNYWYSERLNLLSFQEKLKVIFNVFIERYTLALILIIISILIIGQSLWEQYNSQDKIDTYSTLKNSTESSNSNYAQSFVLTFETTKKAEELSNQAISSEESILKQMEADLNSQKVVQDQMANSKKRRSNWE